jgi:hypothetical protein
VFALKQLQFDRRMLTLMDFEDQEAAPKLAFTQRTMSLRTTNGRRYRIVAASLRPEDIAAADRIVDALREEGWPHANRSLVIREAIGALADVLRERPSEEVFRALHRTTGSADSSQYEAE